MILLHVGPTVFVDRSATLPFALANLAIKAYRRNVDRNAFPARNALHPNLASTSNAKILVLELAVEMPNAKWSTTIRSVSVHPDGPEIH